MLLHTSRTYSVRQLHLFSMTLPNVSNIIQYLKLDLGFRSAALERFQQAKTAIFFSLNASFPYLLVTFTKLERLSLGPQTLIHYQTIIGKAVQFQVFSHLVAIDILIPPIQSASNRPKLSSLFVRCGFLHQLVTFLPSSSDFFAFPRKASLLALLVHHVTLMQLIANPQRQCIYQKEQPTVFLAAWTPSPSFQSLSLAQQSFVLMSHSQFPTCSSLLLQSARWQRHFHGRWRASAIFQVIIFREQGSSPEQQSALLALRQVCERGELNFQIVP